MTLEQFQRGQLAAYAFRQAGGTGSINCLKAICYVMANRVKAGWHGGGWLDAIRDAKDSEAHEDQPCELSLRSPALQGLLRDIEEIYGGTGDDETKRAVGKCLYWSVLTRRDYRPWFVEKIIRDPENHPRRSQVGTIILYE